MGNIQERYKKISSNIDTAKNDIQVTPYNEVVFIEIWKNIFTNSAKWYPLFLLVLNFEESNLISKDGLCDFLKEKYRYLIQISKIDLAKYEYNLPYLSLFSKYKIDT